MPDAIHNSVTIRCSPEVAFDYLSDLRNELDWNPRCQVVEKLTDGPVGVGTRYRAKWQGSPYGEVELVAFERPRRWTGHMAGRLEVTATGTLEPVAGGTRLHFEFEPRAHGVFRLLLPLFMVMFRRQEEANMGRIREALEQRSHEPPAP